MEIPAYFVGIFVIDKIGRRPTLSSGLIVGGVACLIVGLIPERELFTHTVIETRFILVFRH